ncbi:hypothetical protein D3C86_1487860 [compost metagenome]
MRGEAVECAVHLIERGAIFGPKKLAACGFGNTLQFAQIDFGFARSTGIPNADGVNHYSLGTGHLSSMIRGNCATGVVTVGEQYQDFFLFLGFFQHFEA